MKYTLLTLCLLFSATAVFAQKYTIEGTVANQNGPMAKVSIHSKNRITFGTETDAKGKFSVKSEHGETLVFSFLGYEKVEYLVTENNNNLVISMIESLEGIDEVIVTAFGGQRKISSVAAVTTLNTKELQRPTSSVANLIGGRVAGVITMQTSGEPGKDIADFWIRGIGTFGANSSALVLIDGLEGNINSIDPADIESFSVLKDASATAVYGVRGANGVVLVTTKRGIADRLRITARASFTMSSLNRLPDYIGAYDYALLANEARAARYEEPIYSPVEMDIIKNGLDRDIYPDVNWQDEMVKRSSFKSNYYISARGGSSSAKYFLSLATSQDNAAYKVDTNSPYSANVGYNTYNYRANIDMNLTSTTSLYFGTDGFLALHNQPGVANTDFIWRSQARINPLLLPRQYSNGQYPAIGSDSGTSPYVLINRMGRRSNQEFRGKTTLALEQDLSFLTKGLKFRVQGAYDIVSWFNEERLIQPALYEAVGRSQKGELITVERVQQSEVRYGRSTNQFRKYHFEGTVNYDRVFGKDHRTSALVYYYMSDQKNANEGTTNMNSIPMRYQGISSRLTYGFRDTYMVDFNFGYTGSENFQPGRQFGFFPSIALGWIPTQYEFMKSAMPFMDLLKFRVSYGTVGNDRISDRRFPYLTLVNRYKTNPFGSTSVEALTENVIGADNLRWEKATKSDLGIEMQFLKNRLSFVLDLFKDERDGIFQQRVQVPIYVGLVSMPYSNVGKMESYGADGNVSFSQNIGRDMSLTVRGNFTYSRNNVINWEEANPKYPYQEISGYPLGVLRGYKSLGLFKDQHDIDTSPIQTFGPVMPGDIKYCDVNGDGRIDRDDALPISNSATLPLLMYGFGAEFRYKQVSVGVLFRGTGKSTAYHVGLDVRGYGVNGLGYMPFFDGREGNVLAAANDPKNRWIPRDYAIANGIDPALAENPNARYPRLQYGRNNNNSQLSDFWLSDSRYLRLQEVTVSYNLSKPFLSKVGISSVDVQLVGNNLYLWDKIKTFDPEQALYNGQVYPIPTTFTLQLFLHF